MRRPFILLQAGLLLALSVAAAAFGVADIYRYEAATPVEGWIWSGDEGPPAWGREQVERYLWRASRLAPFDAQIKSDLGRLYESRGVAALVESDPGELNEQPSREALAPGAHADLDTALEFHRQALALRPASSGSWANLALLKVTQQDIDAEFALAAKRAMTLGPWESVVQASIAGGSLSVWTQLPAPMKADIEHAVHRGLSNGSRLMPLVARRFELFEPTSKEQPVTGE